MANRLRARWAPLPAWATSLPLLQVMGAPVLLARPAHPRRHDGLVHELSDQVNPEADRGRLAP